MVGAGHRVHFSITRHLAPKVRVDVSSSTSSSFWNVAWGCDQGQDRWRVLRNHGIMQDTCPETFQKVLRIRASKTVDFLSDRETLPKLFLSTLSITPMEKVMFQFMHWQKTEAYLKSIDPPMVSMSHPVSSPACRAIRVLCGHMTSGLMSPTDPNSFSIMEIAQCFSANFNVLPAVLFCVCFYCLSFTHGSANLGLPGDIPADFADSVFWSLVTAVGQLHTRLVVPYQGHKYSNIMLTMLTINTPNCMLSLIIIGGGCRGSFFCCNWQRFWWLYGEAVQDCHGAWQSYWIHSVQGTKRKR